MLDMVEVRPRKAWGEFNPQGLSDAAGTGPAQQLRAQAAAGGPITTPPCTVLGTAPTVLATVTVDPRGNPTTHRFNSNGYLIAQTDALGQTTTFERANGTNLLLSTTDPLGRVTRFAYDASGNVTSIIDAAGNVRTFTYEPTFNRVASITDPLGNLTTFEYDAQGNLIAITDPLQNTKPAVERLKTRIANNAFGQPLSITDPLGNVTTFAYGDQGNLVTITDPLGNSTTRTYDGVARLLLQTDPRGKSTRFVYDELNRITQITDALNGVTAFTYDGNGNLLTVTDARGNTTTHTYDPMDRLATRTDPLGRQETYQYDPNGNLIQFTDRKGQVSTFNYDSLNRRTRSDFADGTFTAFTYDGAGRLVQASDSQTGAIVEEYDLLDRLIRETTPQGSIQYAYDTAGRRTQMTVDGQSPVSYTYDAASRLTQITQAPLNPVTLQYDATGRRTLLTLPNGVSTEYQYDAASHLTALIYRNALGPLGDLTYQYNAIGNPIAVGGSLARIVLPGPVVTANYDAANEQLAFGGKSMTFDQNGNLTSITDPTGTTNFTWDARNRLAGLSSPSTTGSFQYDALGRRIQKVVGGAITTYQYDGLDITRELFNGTDVTYIQGLNLDEPFTRIEEGTTVLAYLADALGSAVALADPSGALSTTYSYEPFGRTIISGVASNNVFHFTGRENDQTGLYYFRARYYDPQLQRFISEDPLGFNAGDANFYSYVFNEPTRLRDPSGLAVDPVSWTAAAIACGGGALIGDLTVLAIYGRKATLAQLAQGAVLGCGAGMLALYSTIAAAGAGVVSFTAAELTGGAAVQVARATTGFGQAIQSLKSSIAAGRGPWQLTSAHIEQATARAYRGAISIEQVFTNIETGDRVIRHFIVRNGEILHETFRRFPKFGMQ